MLRSINGSWYSTDIINTKQFNGGVLLRCSYNNFYIIWNESPVFPYFIKAQEANEVMVLGAVNDKLCVQLKKGDRYKVEVYDKEDNLPIRTIKDWPKEENFEIKKDERGFYIESVIKRYYLDGFKDDDYALTRVEERFKTNEGYMYILYVGDDYFQLYNPQTKEIEVDKIKTYYFQRDRTNPENTICNYISIAFGGREKFVLYNLNTKERYKISSDSAFIEISPNVFTYTIGYSNGIFFADSETTMGPFVWCGTVIEKRFVVVVPKQETQYAILDLEKQEIQNIRFDDFYNYKTVDACENILRVIIDRQPYIYLLKTGEVFRAESNTSNVATYEFTNNIIYAFQQPSGHFCIYSTLQGVIADDVIIENIWPKCMWFVKDNKVYVYYSDENGTFCPSPIINGIDTSGMDAFSVIGTPNDDVTLFLVYFKATNPDESNNRTFAILDYMKGLMGVSKESGKPSDVTDEERQRITNLFSPQGAQIAEEFRRFLNRMNDL
jgi:hypothetical protein